MMVENGRTNCPWDSWIMCWQLESTSADATWVPACAADATAARLLQGRKEHSLNKRDYPTSCNPTSSHSLTLWQRTHKFSVRLLAGYLPQ